MMRLSLSRLVLLAGACAARPVFAQHAPVPASVAAPHLAAAAQADTLLHVTAPGRFAISTHSASGAALDVVDMIMGPTERSGTPGSADGRLDLLLDIGTYKIRTFSADGAKGSVDVLAHPFVPAAPPAAVTPGAVISGTLDDLQQRSFWFAVRDDQPVRLEAAGRALADLRIWRDGRDLVASEPEVSTIEPVHGHKLRDVVISQTLPPGTYLVTAYGGPQQVWADGDTNVPFYLRDGASDALRLGWAGGKIGPFGSEVFNAAGAANLFALTMPGPAMLVVDGEAAEIDKTSRVPEAVLGEAARTGDHLVEVHGAAGAAFAVRATTLRDQWRITVPGSYWLTGQTSGLGGDQPPATLILARDTAKGFDVVASNVPELAPGHAWRARFNLTGTTSLLFHQTEGGAFAARLTGVALAATQVETLGSGEALPADASGQWNLNPGWYRLILAPSAHAWGAVDLTIGTPGVTAQVTPPGPADPVISFGEQRVDAAGPGEGALQLFGNSAPGARTGLDARLTPVAIDAEPLSVSQTQGVSLDIPVQHAAGVLSAVEIGRGTVDLQEVADLGVVRLPAPDHARVVTLGWRKPAPAQTVPPPEPASARVQLQAGTPYFTDLREDHGRSFDLVVANGGLYRVETTGRLHTSGAIGTHFVPQLLTADGNGIGQNMLLQGWLRAGQYRVDLTAKASSGHAGLQASPAPLLTVAPLMPGGSARASLPAGSGLKVPVEITEKGDYRLELLGLNHPFTARLEDSEGWPLAAAGPLETSTQTLLPGQYRLLVMPQPVDTRAVMRLTRVLPPPVLAGHGPHPLPFDLEQRLTWREPAGRNDPRLPDEWCFTLAAAAEVTVRIGDGMQGSLLRPDGAVAAHVVGGVPFHGRLEPGAYRVQATSQGRNDRLDYSIGLTAKELQPAAPRALRLPAVVDFALAQDRVVSLTSFGVTPVRAVLRDADGHLLGRYGARDDDWNIALSRLLPAGRYTLELASAAVPRQANVPFNHNDRPGQAQDAQAGQDGQDSAPDDPGQAMQPPGQPEDGDGSPTPYRAQDGAPESEDEGALPRGQTELTLSLPAEAEMAALAGESARLQGGGVARLALPPPAPGNLILAGARSSAALVLSLEARDGTGAWRSRAAAEGLAPVLAVPAAGGAWRLSVWQVDGGTLPVTVAARVLAAPAIGGQPRLDPVPLTWVTDDLAVAHVALASRAAMALSGDSAGVLAAAWPDHPAMAAQGGLLVPQGDDLWLIGPRHAAPRLAPVPAGTPLTLTLDADARAALPVQNAALTAWVAEAPGQPGLQGGHGMGLAEDSSVALTEAGATATVWNAGADDVLRVNLHPVALRLSDAARPPAALAPASAVVVDLPERALRLHLDLPPGVAAVAGWPEPGAVTAWAGRGAISRTIEGSWHRLLLVNTGAAPAPVTLGWDGLDQPAALTPDAAVKRFFGAAGSLDLRVAAQAGQTLNVAGATDATFLGDNGAVARGPRLRLAGPGRLVVTHGPGLVAAWLEGAGAQPWPMPAPVAAALPSTIALAGTAMRLALAPAAPALVRLRSTAPLILAVNDAAPILFAAGVAESFYLPAGGASLTLISPQDGPLTGSLALTASPVLKAVEGLGAAVTVAPGDSVAFGFALTAPARIGVGVRAQPDQAELRLLDAHGSTLATGAAMLRDLPAGDYVLQARVPQDGTTTIIRPALVGLVPRPNGPPPETIAYYRALAGLTSAAPGERAP